MSKQILGLDIGSNSIGWALLNEENDKPSKITAIGSRIFSKAVEDDKPTPKNQARRIARLARRVIQRRSRRKSRMLKYLVKLKLLPPELQDHSQPEIILNDLGDPYSLRAKALDQKVSEYELGRIFLHLVQRRGFLSNRKTLIGDMADDPDVLEVLEELETTSDSSSDSAKEETEFKQDISQLRNAINEHKCRTLGEYLSQLDSHSCKRNRTHNGGHIRTDRQMYREELELIWLKQSEYHKALTDDVKEQIEEIIFFQRPLKLKSDRIGKCSLEPSRKRIRVAHPYYQRFRYLQDVNNLKYFDPYTEKWQFLDEGQREKLREHFESNPGINLTDLRKLCGFDRKYSFNLERGNKKLKGNLTACGIRKVFPEWDELNEDKQDALIEDILTIQKKSVLKSRLINHWHLPKEKAIDICFLEFEQGHGDVSKKAIRALLPHLEDGQLFSDARISAGYDYEVIDTEPEEKLALPEETNNPIVNRALHELRRLVNAIISEYGKLDVIRIEMARDLEMNTKRYKAFIRQQKENTKANDKATEAFQEQSKISPHLKLSSYPSRTDKIKYRLWLDQDMCCAYSGRTISRSSLFSPEIDIDHILPYSLSLDDSYMNKVVCYTEENRYKGQKTPKDAYSDNEDKWNQIVQRIGKWDKKLASKRNRFYQSGDDIMERDFINSQLNDTRYISKVALSYLKTLGVDITTTKGQLTAWLRHQWDFDELIGNSREKDRVDHRHHAIDALVTACVDRSFYRTLVKTAKEHERSHPELKMRDLHVDPPFSEIKDQLDTALKEMVVSHQPSRKLSGALHEKTGLGFIEGVGNITRKQLAPNFKVKQVEDIYDEQVRELVRNHLAKHGDDPKKAFAEGFELKHKDGKTPIKRVRVVQSKTTLDKLTETKFGIRDKNGEIFKWLVYGNTHHVEIIKNRKTGKYSGVFVTAMEASHRAKGINMEKQPIIKTSHGDDSEFIMALHINDTVRVVSEEVVSYYRVQKLEAPAGIMLRLHHAANLKNANEQIRKSINILMNEFKMEKIAINVLGKIIK